jgi:hypothetical protein
MRIEVPIPQSPIQDSSGHVTKEWRAFFLNIVRALRSDTGTLDDSDVLQSAPTAESAISDLAQRVAQLEEALVPPQTNAQAIADLQAMMPAPVEVLVGGVAGPASSTDNAVARFNGTTGKKIQNSSFIVDDSGHISSFGGNIAFPASQSASGDANTLDDYQEGSFTPVFTAATPPTGVTYGTQVGDYTKIGNLVLFHLRVQLTNKGAGGAGAISITGLPFTSANDIGNTADIGHDNITFTGGYTALVAFVAANSTVLTINEQGSAVAALGVTWANTANTSDFVITGFYHV